MLKYAFYCTKKNEITKLIGREKNV